MSGAKNRHSKNKKKKNNQFRETRVEKEARYRRESAEIHRREQASLRAPEPDESLVSVQSTEISLEGGAFITGQLTDGAISSGDEIAVFQDQEIFEARNALVSLLREEASPPYTMKEYFDKWYITDAAGKRTLRSELHPPSHEGHGRKELS